MAFAKINLIGNLGGDPELRYTPSQRSVTSFSVAVSHSKPDGNGGWEDMGTDWYRVTVWGERGERLVERLSKGSKVFVSGRFKTREFEGRDGETRTSLDITADDVILVGGRRDDSGDDAQERTATPSNGGGGSSAPANDDLDDLPF